MGADVNYDFSLVTGLILAGGRASRMNNVDKGLQQLNGRSLVEHVIARMQPQVGTLALNANRHLEHYAELGFPVWPDNGVSVTAHGEPDFNGPLAGVETGLIHCRTPYLLIAPCDCPFLPADLTLRLMASLLSAPEQCDIAVACTGDPQAPKLQPVFCLMKISMRHQLQQYLHSGGRKMDGWYGDAAIIRVHFEEDSAFQNINTPEELRMASTSRFEN